MIRRRKTSVTTPHFECYETTDSFERKIVFFVSAESPGAELPLIVFIQGSGCHSLFHLNGDMVRGGYQNVLLAAAGERSRVVAVEKPGVRFLDWPRGGDARPCTPEFHQEHTLERWAEAVSTAVRAAAGLGGVDTGKLLVMGHSEGGITAARVAAVNSAVSHVALLSSSGPTQLFDLAATGHDDVYSEFAKIMAHPDSVQEFAWGHPYRRWSSFLSTSTLDELLRSRARIYLAHGAEDDVVPVAAFDVLRAELIRHARDVTTERIEQAGHGLRRRGQAQTAGMRAVFGRVVEWFLA